MQSYGVRSERFRPNSLEAGAQLFLHSITRGKVGCLDTQGFPFILEPLLYLLEAIIDLESSIVQVGL